jgi:hypothetical protein
MPDITMTFLTGSTSYTLSDSDVEVLADLTSNPQVLTDVAMDEFKRRIRQEMTLRLRERAKGIVQAYVEGDEERRQAIEEAATS